MVEVHVLPPQAEDLCRSKPEADADGEDGLEAMALIAPSSWRAWAVEKKSLSPASTAGTSARAATLRAINSRFMAAKRAVRSAALMRLTVRSASSATFRSGVPEPRRPGACRG